jgi:uncharacterized protein YidB (DUF937 family)
MGLLDQVTGALAGAKAGGANTMLLQQLISMLSKPGALTSLMNAFQENGLDSVLQSWIGTGQNLPISAAQLQQVLGNDTLAQLAAKAGMQVPTATSALSSLLPQVVDKLSPGGKMPSTNDLGGLLAAAGKLLG